MVNEIGECETPTGKGILDYKRELWASLLRLLCLFVIVRREETERLKKKKE